MAAPETSAAAPTTPVPVPEYKPMVSIEESLASADHILSLIDGKPYKALKRHLSAHGLTPAEYRGRYGLPADYPLVARGYSAARREVALKLGLGGKRTRSPAPVVEEVPAPPAAEVPEPSVAETPSAKPAPVRRSRAKAVEARPKPAEEKPKRKVSKGAPAKARVASSEAAEKPKRSRATKADAEAVPSAEPVPEATIVEG